MSKTSKPKGGKKNKAAALTDTVKADPAKADTASQGRPSALSGEVAEYWADFQAAQPKAVHEVRKLTRRAGAEAAVSDLKKKVRREWRDLRRAAAPIRDHDAAGEHLRAALTELEATPAELQRFEEGWAARRAELVTRHPLPAEVPAGYDLPADWEARAAKALDADRKELLKQGKKLMKRVDGDSEPWHDWRKLMKRYRYTLELGGKAPKEVKTMLEHLGRLQDAEVLLELLDSEQGHFSAEHLKALKSREKTARLQARAAALELWPQLKAHLKGEDVTAEDTEGAVDGSEATAQAAPTKAEQSEPAPAKTPAKPARQAKAKATKPASAAKASTAKTSASRTAAKAAAPKADAQATAAASAKASTTKAASTKPASRRTSTAKSATAKASSAGKAATAKASAPKTGAAKTGTAATKAAPKAATAKPAAKTSAAKTPAAKAAPSKAKASTAKKKA